MSPEDYKWIGLAGLVVFGLAGFLVWKLAPRKPKGRK